MRIAAKGLFLLFATSTCLFSQTPSSSEDHTQQIADVFRQTKTIQVSCGDDADMQACKFFVNALNVALRNQHISAVLYYDPEVMVQSFFVPPRLLPSLFVTLRLIEDGPPEATRLNLGGFCFDSKRADYYAGISLPRWSEIEGGRDTGPMESNKAAAASKIAKQFVDYWTDTVKEDHKEEAEKIRMKTFEAPAATVYAAVVQLASEYYELMSATKEGYSVVFPDSQFGESKSWVVTAVCHEKGEKSVVTLYFKREQSARLVGVEKLKDKMAEKFWTRLEKTLKRNQGLGDGG